MVFYNQNSDFSPRIASHYGSQPSSVVLCTRNTGIMTRINSLYGSQTSPVVLCKQSSMISTRISSLHGSQTSPVVLCMPNKVISIRNTSLYGSLPSSACETATLGPELQDSIGPRPHLWRFVLKAATLVPELQVSMGPSPHLWLLLANHDFWIWIPHLYGSQTWPMVLCMQNSVIRSRNTSLLGSHTSAVVLCM